MEGRFASTKRLCSTPRPAGSSSLMQLVWVPKVTTPRHLSGSTAHEAHAPHHPRTHTHTHTHTRTHAHTHHTHDTHYHTHNTHTRTHTHTHKGLRPALSVSSGVSDLSLNLGGAPWSHSETLLRQELEQETLASTANRRFTTFPSRAHLTNTHSRLPHNR
jgi:hypothetical protein